MGGIAEYHGVFLEDWIGYGDAAGASAKTYGNWCAHMPPKLGMRLDTAVDKERTGRLRGYAMKSSGDSPAADYRKNVRKRR